MMKYPYMFGLLAFFGMTSGCGANAGAAEESPDPLGTAEQALDQWIGPISEEPNINLAACFGSAQGVIAARCTGGFCDNNYLDCTSLPASVLVTTNYYFTNYISEESPNNFVVCDNNQGTTTPTGVVIGMRATGSNSDNISLYCEPVFTSLRNCGWTPYFSEEQGTQDFRSRLANSFATGVRCKGSRCDQVSYQICNF